MDLIMTTNVADFLAERGNGTIFADATFIPTSQDLKVRIKPGTRIRVPRGEGTVQDYLTRKVKADCEEVMPPRVMLRCLLTANQTEREFVSKQLDITEQAFLNLMNWNVPEGRLQVFYFGFWTCRVWAGRFEYFRLVTAIKELP